MTSTRDLAPVLPDDTGIEGAIQNNEAPVRSSAAGVAQRVQSTLANVARKVAGTGSTRTSARRTNVSVPYAATRRRASFFGFKPPPTTILNFKIPKRAIPAVPKQARAAPTVSKQARRGLFTPIFSAIFANKKRKTFNRPPPGTSRSSSILSNSPQSSEREEGDIFPSPGSGRVVPVLSASSAKSSSSADSIDPSQSEHSSLEEYEDHGKDDNDSPGTLSPTPSVRLQNTPVLYTQDPPSTWQGTAMPSPVPGPPIAQDAQLPMTQNEVSHGPASSSRVLHSKYIRPEHRQVCKWYTWYTDIMCGLSCRIPSPPMLMAISAIIY